MKMLLFLGLFLSGCAHGNLVMMSGGVTAYAVTCDSDQLGDCYKEATKVCDGVYKTVSLIEGHTDGCNLLHCSSTNTQLFYQCGKVGW